MTGLVVPDRIEPTVAFRIWGIDARRRLTRPWQGSGPNPDFGALLPMNWPKIDVRWPGRTRITAQCLGREYTVPDREPHEAPGTGCRCGVYGMARLPDVAEPLLLSLSDEARRYARLSRRRAPSHDWPLTDDGQQARWAVAGQVALWGRTIEGSHGYRAEFGYPKDLWLLPPAAWGTTDLDATAELASVILQRLRARYGVPVGYAAHDADWNRLLADPDLGRFFSWRLTNVGHDQLCERISGAGLPTDKAPTVADALERWLQRHGNPSLRSDERVINTYLGPAVGDIPLHRLSPSHLAAYRAEPPSSPRAGKAIGERSVQTHLSLLRGAVIAAHHFGWAVSPSVRMA